MRSGLDLVQLRLLYVAELQTVAFLILRDSPPAGFRGFPAFGEDCSNREKPTLTDSRLPAYISVRAMEGTLSTERVDGREAGLASP